MNTEYMRLSEYTVIFVKIFKIIKTNYLYSILYYKKK